MNEEFERLAILLQDVCEANDIEEFGLDDYGVCGLEFRESLYINIALHSNTTELIMYTPLGEVTEENREDIFAELLQANLFPRNPGAFCFAIANFDTVILTARLPLVGLDAKAFQDVLEPFLDLAETWQERLLELPSEEDAPQAEPETSSESDTTSSPETPAPAAEEPKAPAPPEELPPMPNHMAFMIKG